MPANASYLGRLICGQDYSRQVFFQISSPPYIPLLRLKLLNKAQLPHCAPLQKWHGRRQIQSMPRVWFGESSAWESSVRTAGMKTMYRKNYIKVVPAAGGLISLSFEQCSCICPFCTCRLIFNHERIWQCKCHQYAIYTRALCWWDLTSKARFLGDNHADFTAKESIPAHKKIKIKSKLRSKCPKE